MSAANEELQMSPHVSTCLHYENHSDALSDISSQQTLELSARQRKQLQQMFQKGMDDVSCATILKLDVEPVRAFHEHWASGETFGTHFPMSPEEQSQLQQLFDRQIDEETCANILHMPIGSVQSFKEENSLTNKFAQGDVAAVAVYVRRLSDRTAANALTKALAAAKDPAFKVTAASAAAGSVVGGVAGGGAGTVIGGAVGAAAGIIPAVFTFGTSIPIGMAVGSGVGLCTGAAVGSSVGAVAGGASGYCGFAYRTTIRNTGISLLTRARGIAGRVSPKAIVYLEDCEKPDLDDSLKVHDSDKLAFDESVPHRAG